MTAALAPAPDKADAAACGTAAAVPTAGRRPVADRLLMAVWLAAFGVLAVLVWPTALGGATSVTIVAGTSMEPTSHTGDAAIVRRGPDPVPGDVIVYTVPAGEPGEGRNVIHRVIGGDADAGYVTRGDNRSTPDVWRPRRDDVLGTVRAVVPRGGAVVRALLSPGALGLAASGLFLWVAWPRRADDGDGGAPADG